MCHVLETAIVLFSISLSHCIFVLPRVAEYRVWALEGRAVVFKVSDNKTECERLARKRGVREVNHEMQPSIEVVFKDGEYRANITWQYVLNGDRLPRVFFINLTFYDIVVLNNPKFIDDACILLQLVGNRKVKDITISATADFYFDFLPLLPQPNIGLVATVWSYTKQGRRCRSLRSLPEKKGSCASNVQCSSDYSYPVSKNDHAFRQCACYRKNYGTPQLQWRYDESARRFVIHFANVPPFLQQATIDIIDVTNDSSLVVIHIPKENITDGEINVVSGEFGPGDYTVYVRVKLKLDMECVDAGDYERLYVTQISDMCNYQELYYVTFSNTITVNLVNADSDIESIKDRDTVKDRETILGIVGGVVLVTMVTTITFLIVRCCRRKEHTHRTCQSDTNRSQLSEDIINSPNNIEMEEFRPESRSLLHAANNNQSLPGESEKLETEFIHTHQWTSSLNSGMGPNQTSPYQTANTSPSEMEDSKRQYQVMLLYHADSRNEKHTGRVYQFSQILKNEYGLCVENKPRRNWKDFAESAFVSYKNVVLIISEGLYELCYYYSRNEQIPSNILEERYQEIVPCIVLEQMRRLTQEHTRHCNVTLHIVTFDNETAILKRFLNDHQFITSKNSFVYIFCDKDINTQTDILDALVTRLKPADEQQRIPCQQQMMDINFGV